MAVTTARRRSWSGCPCSTKTSSTCRICAPTATRTRGLLLRRHFRNAPGRCHTWLDVPFRHYEDGWRWPEVALCVWSLAPRLAPPNLVSNANVRMLRILRCYPIGVRGACLTEPTGAEYRASYAAGTQSSSAYGFVAGNPNGQACWCSESGDRVLGGRYLARLVLLDHARR